VTARIAAALTIAIAIQGCGKTDLFYWGGDASGDSDTDADSDVDSDSDTDTDSDLPFDCDALPPGPFDPEQVSGAIATLDLAFDAEGNLVGNDTEAIYKTPWGGEPQVFVADIDFRGGLEYLPDGHLIYADNNPGELVRVDPDGGQHTVLDGLSYPRGVAVDPQGMVYVTETAAARILRVGPYTSSLEVIVDELQYVSAVAFDPAYETLYAVTSSTSSENTIYRLGFDADGNPGELEEWVTGVGYSCHVGLGVDACGNVYVANHACLEGPLDHTFIHRISPDGTLEPEPIVDIPSQYLPGLEWGSGIGAWDENSLYISNSNSHEVFGIDLGVPSKPKVYP
jgi:hypothetical protein